MTDREDDGAARRRIAFQTPPQHGPERKKLTSFAASSKGLNMFASPIVRKLGRLALTSAAAGATIAIVFLGGPADAAQAATVRMGGRGI